MSRHQFHARHYRTEEVCLIEVHDGRYASIQPLAPSTQASTYLPWIAPGLCDVQVNGFGGVDFNLPPTDSNSWARADQALATHGCTHYLATIITRPEGSYAPLLQAWESSPKPDNLGCWGYHLEGPFLNPDPGTRGAHRPEWMIPPSAEFLSHLQTATHDRVRLLTLAPEIDWPHARDFITTATAQDLRLSAGHSLLMGVELQESIKAGLTAWTHLGNAAPTPCPKFDNVLLYALASDLTYASLIPDGLHLPPHAFRALARALGSRLLLTTDAMAGAGMAQGIYTLGSQSVAVGLDGRATLPETGKLAGSTLTPFTGVFRAAAMGGLSWVDCWEAFSTRPARWLGQEHDLIVGQEASFCLFLTEPAPLLQQVWRQGERLV